MGIRGGYAISDALRKLRRDKSPLIRNAPPIDPIAKAAYEAGYKKGYEDRSNDVPQSCASRLRVWWGCACRNFKPQSSSEGDPNA